MSRKYRRQKEFNFVTIAPQQNSSDNPVASRLRGIQDQFRSNWRGLNPEDIGKAGVPLNTKQTTNFLQFYNEKSLIYYNSIIGTVFVQKDRKILDSDYRPPIFQFQLIQEDQLVPEGQIPNNYSKSRFINRSDLMYRVYKTEGRLVRSVLEAHEFRFTDSHDWNILWIGSSAKPYNYEGLNDYQKINHFPNSYEITRKDRLCSTIVSMQEKFGRQQFNFIPDTYILPDEYADFYAHFNKEKYSMWIIKPSASSRGRGISLVDSLSEVPLHESCVICKYLHNPLLINGLKFDLRIYVAVTSYNPLRIYIYPEGLARFATEQYAPGNKSNKFMHLTNYSINKKSEKFVQNDDFESDDVGSKWSLSALFRHLDSVGVDTNLLWSRIYDIVIKSLISIEPSVVENLKKQSTHRNNCFELFGFDIIIDSNLKPWLLEVNLSPSLATDSPLDFNIKTNLLVDLFNLVGVRSFDRKKEGFNRARNRIRAKMRQSTFSKTRNKSAQDIASLIQTNQFREALFETLEEQQRCSNFVRIYPTKGTDIFDVFFNSNRIVNMALYYVLYQKMLNEEEFLPPRPITSSQQTPKQRNTRNIRSQSQQRELIVKRNLCRKCKTPIIKETGCLACNKKDEKLVITGDDILIEYVHRIIALLKLIDEGLLKVKWKRSVEQFYTHSIWNMSNIRRNDPPKQWQKLSQRLDEMIERRKKLYQTKGITDLVNPQKQKVLTNFQAEQLEEMLYKTSKNVARELVSSLIDMNGKGVLTDIIKSGLGKSEADNGEDEIETFVRSKASKL